MSPKLRLLLFLRRWHARIGFTAVAFFLFLAVTGLALNHARELGLESRYVHSAGLARWYGLAPESPHEGFRSGRHDLIAANGRWLLDGRVCGERLPEPLGLVDLRDMAVVASGASLYLYGRDGSLIDRLDRSALPGAPVEAIGSKADRIVLRTAAGTFQSSDALSWSPVLHDRIVWSAPAVLSGAERDRYAELLEPGIPWDRLLLDLHSGRLAGRYGPLVVDALAVLLSILSLSGAWLFLKPRHRRDRH